MRNQENYNKLIQNRFIIGLSILISSLFLWMIKGYILTLILAAITAGLAHKLYKILLKRFRKKGITSALVVIIVLMIFIIPLLFFAGIVIDQAVQIAKEVSPFIQKTIQESRTENGGFQLPEWIPQRVKDSILPYKDQVLERLASISGQIGTIVINQISKVTKGSIVFFLQLFIYLYALFFFLMDGNSYIKSIRKYVPMFDHDFDEMLSQGLSITRATLKGALLIGILQGGLIGLAFAVLGIQGAAFWGAIAIVLSIIPSVGSGIVWFPAVIWLFSIGRTEAAIGLLVWGGAIVGSIDNVLRPKLVGQDTKMSDLMILLSTLGGIGFFGVIGFILGPILAGLVLTIWKIYGSHFIDQKQQDNQPIRVKVRSETQINETQIEE